MTSEAIRKQIEETISALQKTTAKATKSKEAAIKYLVEAGIIKAEKPAKHAIKGKK
jgi:hypothetical protein